MGTKVMSLQALAQEKFWANKAECEDAEKAYYMRLSGAKVDGIAAMAGGANADVVKKLKDLEIENKNLKKVTDDLKSMVLKLENRVAALEKGGAKAVPAPAKKEESEDEDVDLFGSESEEEEDAEKDKVRQERLAAYAAKKAKKPALIPKTSVLLDVKPWDERLTWTLC